MGIDFGTKRIGLAVTDPLQIIASPLETVATKQVFEYLKEYLLTEQIEQFVVGEPQKLNGSEAEIMPLIRAFIQNLNKNFPDIPVDLHDERYTSKDAQRIILASGIKKMKRQDKTLVDRISASIILKEWMEKSGRWSITF